MIKKLRTYVNRRKAYNKLKWCAETLNRMNGRWNHLTIGDCMKLQNSLDFIGNNGKVTVKLKPFKEIVW